MSLKPVTKIEALDDKSLNLYCNTLTSNDIKSDELLVGTDDGNYINFSTPDLGLNNDTLHTDGSGNTFWAPSGGGGGGLIYNGTTPITLGTLSKYSNVNGLTVDDSVMIETATELKLNTLRCTGASDPIDPQDLATKNYITGVILPTNLSIGTITSTNLTVDNSNGTGVILPECTTSLAGLINSTDKTKLNGLTVSSITNAGTTSLVSASTGALKGLIAGTNITLTPSGTDITIDASGGGGGGGNTLVISSKELTSATIPASTNVGVNILSATSSFIHPDINCSLIGSGSTSSIQIQKAGSFKVEMFTTVDIVAGASSNQYIGLQICKGNVYNTNVIIDKKFLVPYDNDKIEQSMGCVVDLFLNDTISFWINPNTANIAFPVNVSADIGTNINIYSVGSTNGTASTETTRFNFSGIVDNLNFYNDGNIELGWDAPGNDLEFYMRTSPGGTGDIRIYNIYNAINASTVFVTTPNVLYDLPNGAGITTGGFMTSTICAENDITYPSYKVEVFYATNNVNVVVEKFL
jgi:hypothetical protein